MASLRDQFQKANLLSKKDAKRLAHEDRVHRKEVGGAGAVDREKAERQEELRQKREAQRAADRDQGAVRQEETAAAAELAACRDLLRREVRKPGGRGAAAWYFALPDGRLPYLELPMEDRMQLQAGDLCVVRIGPGSSHDYGLMRIDHGRRVAAALPGSVVWVAAGALARSPA